MTKQTAPAVTVAAQPAYDPYFYNPMLRSYFVTGFNVLPDNAERLAQEQPGLRQHISAVWSFLNWMRDSSPELYSVISNKRPDLVDPAEVVETGKLSVTKNKIFGGSKLNGMGDATATTTSSDGSGSLSDWGKEILSFLKEAAPVYYATDLQKKLLETNLKRAEQGLPPLDSSGIAPTVAVGMSKDVKTLAYVGIGGALLVALMSVMKTKR